MFLEAQARAAAQQEEDAEELLLDPPPLDSATQCPRAPRQLCVDCDPPKAVAQTHCEACDKALCGNCVAICTQGCEWHGATLCRSCCLGHPCVPVPAERVGQESGDEHGPPALAEDSSSSEDGRDAVDSDWSDSSDSDEVEPTAPLTSRVSQGRQRHSQMLSWKHQQPRLGRCKCALNS